MCECISLFTQDEVHSLKTNGISNDIYDNFHALLQQMLLLLPSSPYKSYEFYIVRVISVFISRTTVNITDMLSRRSSSWTVYVLEARRNCLYLEGL